ncbi:hypothetical protein GCM10010182_04290 [Actinomadura cremea]|nr:hypothetical protein GCM10010182_04290 [Actinomadura cremea]
MPGPPTDAFSGTFWWTAAILAVALLPVLAVPRKRPDLEAGRIKEDAM